MYRSLTVSSLALLAACGDPTADDGHTTSSDTGLPIEETALSQTGSTESTDTGVASESGDTASGSETGASAIATDTGGDTDPVVATDTAGDTAPTGATDTAFVADDCALVLDLHLTSWANQASVEVLDATDNSVLYAWDNSAGTAADHTTTSLTVPGVPGPMKIRLGDGPGDGWHGGSADVRDANGQLLASSGAAFTDHNWHTLYLDNDCAGTASPADTAWPLVDDCLVDLEWARTISSASGLAVPAAVRILDEAGTLLLEQEFQTDEAWNAQLDMPSGTYAIAFDKPSGGALSTPVSLTHVSTLQAAEPLRMELPGYDWTWFTVTCPGDTGFTPDPLPEPNQVPGGHAGPWSDTAADADTGDGTCTFAVTTHAPSADPLQVGWRLYDDARNLVAKLSAGGLGSDEMVVARERLSAGRYLLEMTDSGGNGWGGGAVRVLDRDGGILTSTTLASGSIGHAYLDLDCEGDTFEAWDSGPSLSDVDTGWSLGEQMVGCPLFLDVNTAGRATDMDMSITDDQGQLVLDEDDLWATGIPDSDEPQAMVLALPAGTYTLDLVDASSWGTGWHPFAWVHAFSEGGVFLGGGGVNSSAGGGSTYTIEHTCEDTGLWYASNLQDLADTGWEVGPGWNDTDLAETCGYQLQVVTGWSPTAGGWEIHDLEGHLLYSVAPGSMTESTALYNTPVELPSGEYKIVMKDTTGGSFASYDVRENFRLVDRHGDLVDAWTMQDGDSSEHTAYFLLDCEDDTYVPGWDTGWCEPILQDTADPEGLTGCEQLFVVTTNRRANETSMTLSDNQGNVLLDVAEGTLANNSIHYYAADMPTGVYWLQMRESNGYGWDQLDLADDTLAEVYAGNGVCMGDDRLAGPFTLEHTDVDASGDNVKTVPVHVVCEGDTSGTWSDTSWFGDSTWLPEDTSGAGDSGETAESGVP